MGGGFVFFLFSSGTLERFVTALFRTRCGRSAVQVLCRVQRCLWPSTSPSTRETADGTPVFNYHFVNGRCYSWWEWLANSTCSDISPPALVKTANNSTTPSFSEDASAPRPQDTQPFTQVRCLLWAVLRSWSPLVCSPLLRVGCATSCYELRERKSLLPLLFFGAKLKTLPNGIETAEEDLIQETITLHFENASRSRYCLLLPLRLQAC